MKRQVIGNINLFDLEQKILMVDLDNPSTYQEVAVSNFDDLGMNLAKACQKEHCYNVHLYGQEDYLNTAVIPELKHYLGTTYGATELEIEVN